MRPNRTQVSAGIYENLLPCLVLRGLLLTSWGSKNLEKITVNEKKYFERKSADANICMNNIPASKGFFIDKIIF